MTSFCRSVNILFHHQDQTGAHLRVLEARTVEPAHGGHDDVVEVALAAPVPLHRVEAQLERRDPLRAVGAADRRMYGALDGQRARLDRIVAASPGATAASGQPLLMVIVPRAISSSRSDRVKPRASAA
jgi:hypothetical protein